MNIFEALRQSHEVQRLLADQLLQTSGASEERQALFTQLRRELAAHATAEERYFYVPLLMDDNGIDLTRHALAEHHELDELVEQLEQTDPSSSAWLAHARKLHHEIHHHLEEEEHKFFQMSGKILDDDQKDELAVQYLQEFEAQKQKLA